MTEVVAGQSLLADLVARVRLLAATRPRVVIGITGAPGSGKSTLAEHLVTALDPAGRQAAWVPMDGFHLADVELERLGRRDRKGALDTFDVDGYVATLERIRQETDRTVYVPGFDRTIEQPIAGAIPVLPEAEVVVTEGNYLLAGGPGWGRVRAALTEVWFCELDDDERRRRLVARHIRFGKDPEAARRWVAEVDEANARQIAATRSAADLVVDMTGMPAPAPT